MLLLSGLFGAIIGSLVTASFNIWKFHRDELSTRIDDLCKALNDTAEMASNYWAQVYPEDTFEQLKEEARVHAGQNLVDGLYAEIRDSLPSKDAAALDELFSEFVDSATGGTFTELGRAADAMRISKTPQLASMIIVAVRKSHRRTMPFRRIIKGFRAYQRHRLEKMPLD